MGVHLLRRLSDALESGRFVVTAELNPPKGTDLARLFEMAESLRSVVDAFNLTDSHRSHMSMSPLAVARLLVERDIEPILQITCRDRNRIALQGDLLGAYAMGITNVLCMTGDHPKGGDHPDATPVFDLGAVELLRAISSLVSGSDMAGNELKGRPSLLAGAVVNPGAEDMDAELRRMEEKIEAGAAFFQTQTVYDAGAFERFMDRVRQYDVSIIAGYIMLKSAAMARMLNDSVPGVDVPNETVRELDEAEDRRKKSVEIAARVIREIRPMCQGVHIMAVGWESEIPRVLEAAGIRDGAAGEA
ncbi:MAG: methylenetetrahydrofolate reductase [Chloroflexi bacterium]|nr:methylenetetrahydrofolate reductase [Chloroflexota bacterium]